MFKRSMLLAAMISFSIAVSLSAQRPRKVTAHKAEQAAAAKEAGQSGASDASATTFAQLSVTSQAKAKQVYGIDCQLCHGQDGNGQSEIATSMSLKLDNWTDSKSIAGKSNQDLFTIIRQGKDKMPPEPKDRASDAVVHSLILYIRSLAKEHPDVVAPPAPATTSGTTPQSK